MNVDLQKLLNETQAGILATLRFLGVYCEDLFFLTFRPKKFVDRLHARSTDGKRTASALLFLLITLLVFEILVGLIEVLINSESSSFDVGMAVLIQSGILWETSWEALLNRTIPILLALLAASWVVSRIFGFGHYEQKWLHEMFPYALWRAVILISPSLIALCLPLAILVYFLSTSFVEFSNLFTELFNLLLIPVALLGSIFSVRRLTAFYMGLRKVGRPHISKKSTRWLLYRVSVVSSLVIPIWWSAAALAPSAAKVAINPEVEIKFAKDSQHLLISINMRNLSGKTLFAKKQGTYLSWWNDERPVEQLALFVEERVPNGSFELELSSNTELKDGFQSLTYSGDISKAELTPRTYSIYDGMGGPEVEWPTQEEYVATRNSFREILEGRVKGRVDFTSAVITKAGKTSWRTITIKRNGSE